jgi:hypothetical protein
MRRLLVPFILSIAVAIVVAISWATRYQPPLCEVKTGYQAEFKVRSGDTVTLDQKTYVWNGEALFTPSEEVSMGLITPKTAHPGRMIVGEQFYFGGEGVNYRWPLVNCGFDLVGRYTFRIFDYAFTATQDSGIFVPTPTPALVFP